jgi:hypothetical protein
MRIVAKVLTMLGLVAAFVAATTTLATADDVRAQCAKLRFNWKDMNLPPGVVDGSTNIAHGAIVTSGSFTVGWLFQTVRDGSFYMTQFDASTPQSAALNALDIIANKKLIATASGALYELFGPLQFQAAAQSPITINPCF